MFCTSCGENISKVGAFCQFCGSPQATFDQSVETPTYGNLGMPPLTPPAFNAALPGNRAVDNEDVNRGIRATLRYVSAGLFTGAAVFNLAGVFPAYGKGGYSLSDIPSTAAMNYGLISMMVGVAIFLFATLRSYRWTAAAAVSGVVMGASCFAWRFGDITSTLSFSEKIGPGFSLQSIGDICGIAAGVTASVLLVKSRTRLRADLGSLIPLAFGLLALAFTIIYEANSPLIAEAEIGGRIVETRLGGTTFQNFGWTNTTQILLWLVLIVATLFAMLLLPRMAAGWALLTAGSVYTMWNIVTDIVKSFESGPALAVGKTATYSVNLSWGFAWAIAAVSMMFLGGLSTIAMGYLKEPEHT